jgi:DNA-binding CsgD family transcriptional regulator
VGQTGLVPNAVRLTSEVLVGRGEELRSTLAVLGNLAEGRPGVLMVSGPAGIGKTRFVSTVADQLRAGGVRVMTGACLNLGAGAPPYSALIAAFRSVDPPAVQVLDALTGAVGMRRSRLFELLCSTSAALARRRPTILVIEDAHWVDRITRDALLYLTAMVREGRWALVLTFRGDELAARPVAREFLDLLHRDTSAHVTLTALSLEQVATQIYGITRERPSEEYAQHVHRRSGGVPLFVEEVLAAQAAGTTGVPDHLRDLFQARVRGLGAAAARAVEVVAVAGGRCRERLVAEVLEADPAAVATALDRAVAADVLVTDGKGYRMRHELLREAVYGSLPPARRRSLHGRVAVALGAAPQPDAAALAHHWYEADEPAAAVQANLEAAALAERVHAPGEVLTYLERVLEHFDALPADRVAAAGGRGTLLVRAAEAAYLSGAFPSAVALTERCLRLQEPDGPDVSECWERLARYRWVSRDGVGAQEAYEKSVATLAADAPAAVRARVLSGYAWYLSIASQIDDATRWSQRARAAAEESSDPLERCRALLAWGNARVETEHGLAALWAARDLAIAGDAGDELARAYTALDRALRRHGRIAERERVLRDGLGYVAAHGVGKLYAPVMTYLLAELLLDLGRWDEAERLLDEEDPAGDVGMPAMFRQAYRARLAAARGQSSSVVRAVDREAALSVNIPQQPLWRSIALCSHAEACLWSGEADQASMHAAEAGTVTGDPICTAEAMALQARAGADLAEDARRYRGSMLVAPEDLERAAADLLGERHPRIRALGATMVAELSRWDGRRDPVPWREALAAWDGALDPYRAAYCRWRLALALLSTRSGRREAARELEAARETAARLGAEPLIKAIVQQATSARIRLGEQQTAVGPEVIAAKLGLTPRELEILPLVTAGRTNAEIADHLVISPRTVDVHVSRILRKLGATRRTEAADIARRRGLVSH